MNDQNNNFLPPPATQGDAVRVSAIPPGPYPKAQIDAQRAVDILAARNEVASAQLEAGQVALEGTGITEPVAVEAAPAPVERVA